MKLKIAVIFIVCIVLFNGIINNFRVVETKYNLSSDKVNSDYTFAQISDYHSNSEKNGRIIKILKANDPDYILLSGDILESDNMNATIDFVSSLTDISTVVYARGNHDDDFGTYNQFKNKLEQLGVVVVGQESKIIDDLNFIGIEDLDIATLGSDGSFNNMYEKLISEYQSQVVPGMYNVLLAHRPNYLEAYSELGVDLVVSGHAHGGQWQIPFTDIGLIAPDEGLFPTHVHGIFEENNTTQIVSSGNSNPYGPWIPRLFNPEEVVIIKLESV